jgi:hypothetical protein
VLLLLVVAQEDLLEVEEGEEDHPYHQAAAEGVVEVEEASRRWFVTLRASDVVSLIQMSSVG